MFGKNNSSASNVSVNVTLDLSSPAFSGTTSVESLIISNTSDNKKLYLINQIIIGILILQQHIKCH